MGIMIKNSGLRTRFFNLLSGAMPPEILKEDPGILEMHHEEFIKYGEVPPAWEDVIREKLPSSFLKEKILKILKSSTRNSLITGSPVKKPRGKGKKAKRERQSPLKDTSSLTHLGETQRWPTQPLKKK